MPADAAERVGETLHGLLAGVAVHERNAVRRASQLRFCDAGDVLLQANTLSHSVFFPLDAVLTVIRRLRDDRAVGIGLFGSDGMAGIDAAFETKTQAEDVVVQSSGFVYCMQADDLLHQLQSRGGLQKAIFRFAHAFHAQVAQNAVCTRYHSLRQRVAKWLLMIDDRAGSVDGAESRHLLAMALAANDLQLAETLTALISAGAVHDRRSALLIQRDALEVDACECYESPR